MCFAKSKSSDQLSKVYPEKGGVVGRRGAGGREGGGGTVDQAGCMISGYNSNCPY